MKRLVVSPLSNKIYYATVNEKNHTMSASDRKDVTDNCIGAVFEWFAHQMEAGNLEEHSITYPSSQYELVMREKKL